MIIGLSGRMQSGKSELAKICVQEGFHILKFADGLKDLICELINIDRHFLEHNKESLTNYSISYTLLAERLDIEEDIIVKIRESNIFTSIRELMQFIGTDIIRKFNPCWHINNIKAKIKKDVNYCIDDLRFKDEKYYIDSIGGICWYILKPNNFNISNHPSEIDLSWYDFNDQVIINDTKLSTLINKWKRYIKTMQNISCEVLGFTNKLDLRVYLNRSINIDKLSTSDLSKIHKCSRDKIVWWCNNLLVNIKRNKYNSNNMSFLKPTKVSSYYAGLLAADGCIKRSGNSTYRYVIDFGSTDLCLVEGFKKYIESNKLIYSKVSSGYKYGSIFYYFILENPYILQNLKYWCLYPQKSTCEQIPDILRNNTNCLKQWFVGLIDGDGSIFMSKNTLGMTILSSKDVVDFAYDFIPIKGIKNKHKNTDLYELTWYNYKAVDVYNWLSPEICLARKWDKIKYFTKLNTKRRTKIYLEV